MDLVGENSESEVLNTLKSRYHCIHKPQPTAALDDRRYLPSLWVFERRAEEDGPESPLPQSFSNLMVDHYIIDTHIVTERITSALKILRFRKQRVLVQFWSPVPHRKRWLLTSWDQPFGLCEADEGLYSYRSKSEHQAIVVSRENTQLLDPRARVYSQKLPEWSLGVHGGDGFDNIHGYIDLPVFEYSGSRCVGVLEIITSSDYVDYAFEVEEVSRALKDQNLKSPNVFEDPSFSIADDRRQYELDQIFKALKTVCDIQNLPLAQTWALSGYSSYVDNTGNPEPSCGSFDRRCIRKVCMSTADLPFYVRDLSMWAFHEACREQHLEKSQGLVGRSLSSCSSWFCGDVTELDEDDYPLIPIARMSGIASCLAIYMKSLEMDVEYVIEIFLPTRSGYKAGIQRLVETVKKQIRNASLIQLDVMSPLQVIGGIPSDWDLEPPLPLTLLTENGEVPLMLENMEENHMDNEPSNSIAGETSQRVLPYLEKGAKDIDINQGGTKRKHRKISKERSRKTKRSANDLISLDEIRKHYGKSMDEAAAILNVSRSTLKRICRSYGIPRWPYRSVTDKDGDPIDQTDVLINESEKAPSLVFTASNQPVTNTTSITNVLAQQVQPDLPGEYVESEIAIKGKFIKTKAPNNQEYVTIKATYGNNTIKFPFGLGDGLVKLEEQVATRFQLRLGSFSLKYRDEDDDMILVACDSDLKVIKGAFGQSGIVIKLFVDVVAHQSSHA